MKQPDGKAMKRIAMPMVRSEQDWQAILEEIKETFDMEATEENRELIMDVIRECEDEISEETWNAMPPH